MELHIKGKLLGVKTVGADSDGVRIEIVHIQDPMSEGPAENAFVAVESSSAGQKARYISWINYHDLDYASLIEPGLWQVFEASGDYAKLVHWAPYGWDGHAELPSICNECMVSGV